MNQKYLKYHLRPVDSTWNLEVSIVQWAEDLWKPMAFRFYVLLSVANELPNVGTAGSQCTQQRLVDLKTTSEIG